MKAPVAHGGNCVPRSARSFWDELEGLGRRPLSSSPMADRAPLRIRDEMSEGGYPPLRAR